MDICPWKRRSLTIESLVVVVVVVVVVVAAAANDGNLGVFTIL